MDSRCQRQMNSNAGECGSLWWQVKELTLRTKSGVGAGGGVCKKEHHLLVCRTDWRDGHLSHENQLGTTAKV